MMLPRLSFCLSRWLLPATLALASAVPALAATDREQPPRPVPRGVSATTSPFEPPEASDSTFVVNSSEGLDTGCTFRNSGPLVFDILVTRPVENLEELLMRRLIPTTGKLRMPAYDVDFAGEPPPERDRIYFNNVPVDAVFLTGADEVWKLNGFNIPVGLIHFADPDTGAPGINTIRIDIDTASGTEERWCTAIDWAALSIDLPDPVVLVHGIFSDGATWQGPWENTLTELGIPFIAPNLSDSILKLDSIEHNAEKIDEAVTELLAVTKTKRVSLVAHSKGGLDSRHFAEHDDRVARILQMGTPNAGSPLANSLQNAAIRTFGVIPTALFDLLAAPAALQLTTPYMTIYNRSHLHNGDTAYYALAGDYRFGGLGIVDAAFRAFYSGPSDLIVPVWSVHALPYTVNQTMCSSGNDHQARHTGLTQSTCGVSRLAGLLTPRQPVQGGCGVCPQTATASAFPAEPGSQDDFQPGESVADIVEDGTVNVHDFHVGASGRIAFILHYGQGDLDLSLEMPDQTIVNHATAGNLANVEFSTFEDQDGMRFEYYAFEDPLIGTWKATVHMQTPPAGKTEEVYAINTLVTGSTVVLEAELDNTSYVEGEPIVVQAILRDDGTPVLGLDEATATVVLSDNPAATLPMHDDGVAPDLVIGDGIYTARFEDADVAGLYQVLVTVRGGGDARSQLLLAPVARAGSSVGAPFDDQGVDDNANGLFDRLVVTATVEAGSDAGYRLIGVLTGPGGEFVAATDVDADLAAGSHELALEFDGKELFERRVDGPYDLALLRLNEKIDDLLVPVAELVEAHETAAYDFRDFEHGPIVALGVAGDEGVDDGSNDLYDRLLVDIGLEVDEAGEYDVSTRLVDKNGKEIDFAATSDFLAGGENNVRLTFDGTAIGSNAIDGPWLLADLLVTGPGGSLVKTEVGSTSSYGFREFEGAPEVFCGDSTVQAGLGEECDDGNANAGDCCDAECHFEAAGLSCEGDESLCTADECDGAGECAHTDVSAQLCDDSVACTTDTCLPAGGCLSSYVAMCLPPGETCTDFDGDGKVSATDALSILKTAVGLSVCPLSTCDANGSGNVTTTDAFVALRLAVGLFTAIDCPDPS